jgi:D-hexose-6-phosphate mutarotase
MTDAQMITLGVAILAIFAGTLFNNSRISDMGKRIDDLRDSVNRRLDDQNRRLDDHRDSINQHIEDKFRLLDAKLDRIIDMLANHDERITRLEQQRRST